MTERICISRKGDNMSNQKIDSLLGSSHNRMLLLKRKSEVIFVYLFLLLLAVAATLLNSRFAAARNIRNLLVSSTGLLFVTYAQLFIIMLGGVDLSVGSVISLVNVIMVTLIGKNESPLMWIGVILLSVLAGTIVGFINGLIVVKGNQQPIIATLATSTFFGGLALYIMSSPRGFLPSVLTRFVTRGWGDFFPILLFVVVTVIIWLIMYRTKTGRYITAVGGNEASAESSGIPVGSVKIKSFVICSTVAALAGVFITCFATSGSPLIGESYSQRSITAAAVGGAVLAGGKGSVLGCIAAALILGIINNILNLYGVSSYYQFVMQGLILIIALAVSAIRSSK